MARLAAVLKLGYYPLPVEHGPSLRARLSFPEPSTPAAALDPCCGTGAAVAAMTANSGSMLYGVELDASRAEQAQKAGITTIQGSAFDVRSRVERLSLLYLNPPYDFEIGPLSNRRMEALFLKHTYAWLKPKGILVMVIPGRALFSVMDTLTTHFNNIRVYRMEGELSRKYDQYAVFAIRHHNSGKEASAIADKFYWDSTHSESLPTLDRTPDVLYEVPPGGDVQLTYVGIPLDAIEGMMPTSNAWRNAASLLLPRREVAGGRPITPLHGGHVGLLATAGMLNGVFGVGDTRHIARWRPVKHSTTTVEYEGKTKIERTRERFSNELALVFVSGSTRILTETKPVTAGADSQSTDGPLPPDRKTPAEAKLTFPVGRLVFTEGVREFQRETLFSIAILLDRHTSGDWGDVSEPEREENEDAVENGGLRIFSSYSVPEAPDGKILVITEADRSKTTVLLPSEY